jgi:hypothetical protein
MRNIHVRTLKVCRLIERCNVHHDREEEPVSNKGEVVYNAANNYLRTAQLGPVWYVGRPHVIGDPAKANEAFGADGFKVSQYRAGAIIEGNFLTLSHMVR